MKQTNERAIIRLLHAPTGEYTDWNIAGHAVPAVHYMNQAAWKKREELERYLDENSIELGGTSGQLRQGSDDQGTLAPESKKMTDEQIVHVSKLNAKIIQLKMDALSAILDPISPIPDSCENKREFLEQCISSYDVIPAIMDFFSKHSSSSIELPEGCLPPIKITDQNGDPWESEGTKARAKKKRTTG